MQSKSEIEAQRSAFKNLSDELYKTRLKPTDLAAQQPITQYCPMAFNNSGAYWLSDKCRYSKPLFW
ncbi:MAG: DUF3347 domain-containing protein [Flammeovirgaceae bacterium]|nr:DUF3347 domain-containing protein [Flammeovirgaceae bacterium]